MSTQTAVAPRAPDYNEQLVAALKLGDREKVAMALAGAEWAGLSEAAQMVVRRSADVALGIRRESVALLSNHEAYVRHTATGSLRRTVAPVTLSLADKTLWQPGKWSKQGTEWVMEPINPKAGDLTYDGYCAINAVAGCIVGQPGSVEVDGERRTNPYVERATTTNGRPGDIVRIVVEATVAGASPATGNIVVVNYKLDYDPTKDLLHMIATEAKKDRAAESVAYLCDESEPMPTGWKFIPLHFGVGYAINLRNPKIGDLYGSYIGILTNATKKAQTVARRNAMRNHPAFAVHSVLLNANGSATIPVVGWATDERSQNAWASVLRRLAEGGRVDTSILVDVVDVERVYEPEDSAEGDPAEGVEPLPPPADDVTERNKIVAALDDLILLLEPSEARQIVFTAETPTAALRELLTKAETFLKERR